MRFLIDAADNVDKIKPKLDAMVAEWLEGDADALAELMNDGLDDHELAEALLYQRNREWAQWLEERLATPGAVFVAVGAGHLAGRSEEHTSELQSLMRISYAVFCLKKKKTLDTMNNTDRKSYTQN